MFRLSISRNCARTMSSMVRIGKRVAYRSPSDGSREDGPVLPKQPPITFVHITKYLSVSSGAPGPMNFSHQPGFGFSLVLCAWLEADRPVWRSIALLRSALSVPQVSYASSNSGSTPPQSSSRGSRDRKTSWWPVVYEGSGPDEWDFVDSEADFASRASRQGKERAGFEESLVRGASSWDDDAPAVACWEARRGEFVCIDLPFARNADVEERICDCPRIKRADL